MSNYEVLITMQDDIHNLKKMIDAMFDKIEKREEKEMYPQANIYEDKEKLSNALAKLLKKMKAGNISTLTAHKCLDEKPEAVEELKSKIKALEASRRAKSLQVNASLKGLTQ